MGPSGSKTNADLELAAYESHLLTSHFRIHFVNEQSAVARPLLFVEG